MCFGHWGVIFPLRCISLRQLSFTLAFRYLWGLNLLLWLSWSLYLPIFPILIMDTAFTAYQESKLSCLIFLNTGSNNMRNWGLWKTLVWCSVHSVLFICSFVQMHIFPSWEHMAIGLRMLCLTISSLRGSL